MNFDEREIRKDSVTGEVRKRRFCFGSVAALVLSVVLSSLAAPSSCCAVDFYVAPGGSDGNAGSIEKPFATIARARDAIRMLGTDGNTVHLRAGTYHLTEPLRFDERDSGSSGAPNVYRAYGGETAVIKGSLEIPYTMFSTYSGAAVKADLGSYDLTEVAQVFLDDKRLILARFPNYDADNPVGGGFLMVSSDSPGNTTQFRWNPGEVDPQAWTKINRVQVNIFDYYTNHFIDVASIDADQRLVTLQRSTHWNMNETMRYHFQNIFEELDAANEWFWDQDDKVLYLLPPHQLSEADSLSIPVTGNCIEFSGADFIGFEGLVVAECVGNGVYMYDCDAVKLSECTIKNTGGMAVRLHNSVNSEVDACHIFETGSRAVTIEHDKTPYFKSLLDTNNKISNSSIHDTGQFDSDGVQGAVYCASLGNTISWNHIYNTPRIGINIWGNNNVVEYNHVHDVNQKTFDSGGIYIYGASWIRRGNIIRRNYVHDTGGYQMVGGVWKPYPYNTYGIYLDDWASGNHVLYNTVRNTFYGGIFIHGGRDNRVEHNVLLDPKNGPALWFREWNVSNPGYDTLWQELQWVLNSENGWDGAKYLAEYPELATITAARPPQDKIMSGNTVRFNTLIWPSAPAREAYRISDLDIETTAWDGNYLWAGSRALQVNCNGAYISLADWQGYGFDLSAKDIESTVNPDAFVLLVNTEKEAESFALDGETYCDRYRHCRRESVTLEPFQSLVLYRAAECSGGAFFGDISGNGKVSAYDASMAAEAALGLITLTAEQRQKADATGDGSVSADDAPWIAKRAVNPSLVFPVEE